MIRYNIYYNDGTLLGQMQFFYTNKNIIEQAIAEEIEDNNKNTDSKYHISRESFKLVE